MENKKEKIKVVFLITAFDGGGAQKQCISLLNELQKDDSYEIHLIHFYEGINFYLLDQNNIELHQLHTHSFYDVRNILKILKIVKLIKPNALISWLHASDVYAYFVNLFYPKMKWVMTERDSYYPNEFRYKLRSFVGKRADLIVANSSKGKDYWVEKGVNESKTRVVTNILQELETNHYKKESSSPTVLYAGRLEPQKNILNITQFFISLSEIYPDGKFIIIGDGSLQGKIEDLIVNNNKSGCIELLPFQKEISKYFCNTDVFVNISKHEGMPNTVIENIQLGNSVVVSNIPEHTDLLGTDYPYLQNSLEDKDEFIRLVEDALKNRLNNTKILSFAKKKLKKMTAKSVTKEYKLIFNQF